MSKTTRYFPQYLKDCGYHRYWNNRWLRSLKLCLRSKRKTMKTKEVGDGSNYNKQASDPWNFD